MGKIFKTSTLLSGTVIGAGIFSLPFVFTEVGLGLSLVYLLFFAFVSYTVVTKYAEVLVAEGEGHHFRYIAKKYFRGWGGDFASFIVLGEIILVLVVYLILAPRFASLVFGGDTFFYTALFWIAGSLLIFGKEVWAERAEVVGGIGIALVILLILFEGVTRGSMPSLQAVGDLSPWALLLPFGPLLFSLYGRMAVPRMVDAWRGQGESFSLKKSVGVGLAVPILIYIVFVVGVLALNPDISPDTISGLEFLPGSVLAVLGIAGLLTLWTSYFMIGGNAYDILRTDVFDSRILAAAVPVLLPPALLLLGAQDFLGVVSFTGGVFVALDAIFVVLIWSKFKDRSAWKLAPIFLVFALAIVYEVLKFF